MFIAGLLWLEWDRTAKPYKIIVKSLQFWRYGKLFCLSEWSEIAVSIFHITLQAFVFNLNVNHFIQIIWKRN